MEHWLHFIVIIEVMILVLFVFGLALGSFANAVVWRLHEQSKKSKGKRQAELSILKGRSMCPHCHHELAARDLIPVISWLLLKGKCRYCTKPISRQYPIVELLMGVIFVAMYTWWPLSLEGFEIANFIFWLGIALTFMILSVYDLKWYILPNRVIYPLIYATGGWLIVRVIAEADPMLLGRAFIGVLISSGIFYILFRLSDGKWIGGGDVKLGLAIGLLLASPGKSFLTIFLASLIGSAIMLPLMLLKRVKKDTRIPFGPFLMIGTVLAQLFGAAIVAWYSRLVVFT